TYAQLEARANRLARHLQALGVRPGAVVAICAERSTEMVVAVLAALKAGAAYAPVDPAYPEERVAFMLADTHIKVLLTQEHLRATLPDHAARTVSLDGERDLLASYDDAPVESGATLDDLAYVIYTSGSTGRPKGVAMGHRPLANLLAWQAEQSSSQGSRPSGRRTLQFASLSFDVAFQELFSTWCSGGTLVLIRDDLRRDPEAMLAFIRRQQVERLFLPFVALHNLCEAAEYLSASLPGLREVITAGEQLKATNAVRGFFARHADCTLVNQYGPTESHVVTAFALTGPAARWPALPPIGRPIANARIYLLDARLQPVPIGAAGELYIGGLSLARGYLGREELTAERFIADPFSSDPAARLYRTGDLARYRPDGEIDYLGRADAQLKIRGFRVEPGEIEAALRGHPGIREALVLAQEDAGEKRLVAYLISENGAIAPEDLRTLLSRSLPSYMVPSAFAFLDEFPLSPNGKVDRTRLAGTPVGGEARELTAPRTETEHRLAAIWSAVLAVDEIGVHDSFFDLGGHSLMAVRLFSEIERKLGVRLPMSTLFEDATIARQAELVERERREETRWRSLVPMRPGDGDVPLFLIGWAGGEVLPYRDLVENLDPTLPVYGLRAPGVDHRAVPLATVESLAAYYVDEIRRVQPHGPYRLGGFCFSGLIVYEMARQLLEHGETTTTLALIDAYPFRQGPRRRLVASGRTQLQALKQAGSAGRREWARDRRAGLAIRVHQTVHLKTGPRVYELLEARGLQRLIPRRPWNLVLIASNLARRRYTPKPLDVRVEFYRAQRAANDSPTPWEGLAERGVELRSIVAPDISHDGMMHEPHVKRLAEELMRDLNRSSHVTPHAGDASGGAGRGA
ncbi:MAG TPA: amino acid adenylation domain-containing protein, partial [Solirubrobacteraceae bacterium]